MYDGGQNTDILMSNVTYLQNEGCVHFYRKLMRCIRESQEADVMYDCRSRQLDLRECTLNHKQRVWLFRETAASMKHEAEFKKWLRAYDEKFGHPPLLEAVQKVRREAEKEGGASYLFPNGV